MVFLIVMYGCERWTIKKAECWRIDALELWCWRRLLRVPWTAKRSYQSREDSWESLGRKEIKPVHPKGNQPWLFIERTDAEAEAEAPILWPPDVKSRLTGKDSDAGKDWRQEKKGTIKDEMVGWHHWFNGHEFEQTPGDSEGQRNLVCYSSWSHKESRHNLATEQQHPDSKRLSKDLSYFNFYLLK